MENTMRILRTNKLIQTFVLFVVCVISAIIGLALRNTRENIQKFNQSITLQQSDEKVIDRKEFNNEPFTLNDLSVKNTKISPGQKLSMRSLIDGGGTAENWLEALEFTINNTYDKQITYLNFDIMFPETGVDRPMMVYQMDRGIHPTAFGDNLRYGASLALNPGESFTFKLTDEKLKTIREFLELGGFQLANLNQATIRIDTIYFADETKWSQGNMYRLLPGEKPAPGRPAKYELVIK
jgi:hypothetical protein